ncbi:hypothetical protein CHUAL_009429 [Chamberlinius hualienensis]
MASFSASKFRNLFVKPKPNIEAVKRASVQSGNAVASAVNSQRGTAAAAVVASRPLNVTSTSKEKENAEVNDPATPSPVTTATETGNNAYSSAAEDAAMLINTPPGQVATLASSRKPNIPSISTNSSPNKKNVDESTRQVSFAVPPPPPPPPPPQRERNLSGRGTISKEKEKPVRQRYKKGNAPPERSKMTMFDLIYWNPEGSPMVYDGDSSETIVNEVVEDCQRLDEEAVDDPEYNEDSRDRSSSVADDDENNSIAPKVKIGPDGSLIIDEQSLVIQTSAAKRGLPTVNVRESSSTCNYNSFRKKKPTRTWSDNETSKFYMALSTVGTDFSMMQNLFPKRERHELKLKYKREEKCNKVLVDKAIHGQQQYDLSIFEEDNSENENPEVTKKTPKRKRASGEGRKKNVTRSRKKKVRLQDESDAENEPDSVNSVVNSVGSGDPSYVPEVIDSSCFTEASNESTHVPVAAEQSEPDKVGENSTEEEDLSLDNVLKKTRSGRQPKKRVPYTADEQTQKRNKKLDVTQHENDLPHHIVDHGALANDDELTIEERIALLHGVVNVQPIEVSAESVETDYVPLINV